jgi:phage portal protein BeeE
VPGLLDGEHLRLPELDKLLDLAHAPGASRKAMPVPGHAYGMGYDITGPTDIYRKERPPSDTELVTHLVGVAYACAGLRADAVASTPLRLYVKTAQGQMKPKFADASRRMGNPATSPVSGRRKVYLLDGKSNPHLTGILSESDEVEEVRTHPALDFLHGEQEEDDGQPRLSGSDLLWLTCLSLDTLGKGYWLTERDRAMPARPWFLMAHRVTERIEETTGTLKWYEYGTPDKKYLPKEVIKFRVPSLGNAYYDGFSLLEAAIEKVRIARKYDAHTNALLDNMGRPDALWSPKGNQEGEGIGDAEARRVRVAFRREFAQAGRGGLMVSEYPGTLEQLQWPPGDIVELKRAEMIERGICNLFGVPDALLQRNAANLASAETADRAFAKYAVMPLCSRVASSLSRLLRMFDQSGRLFFAFDNPVPSDQEHELKKMQAASSTGIARVNEHRKSMGLEPLDGEAGEYRYIPRGFVPVGDDGKPVEGADPNAAALAVQAERNAAAGNKPPGKKPGKKPPKKKPKK